MNVNEAFLEGVNKLKNAGIEEAKNDSFILWEYITGMNYMDFLLKREEPIEEELYLKYMDCIEKRSQRYPVQYITGTQNFMGIDFFVSENVLIPRQDTETLIETFQNICKIQKKKPENVLDMCCGSGCIGLSLKILGLCDKISLADISDSAIALTNKNACENGVTAQIIKSNLFSEVKGSFDMIVSNPPYIKTKDIEGLMDEVKVFEPKLALDGKEDGLFFYRKIVKEAKAFLKKSGYLIFEIGFDQGESVEKIFLQEGYLHVKVNKDLNKNDRVIYGQMP